MHDVESGHDTAAPGGAPARVSLAGRAALAVALFIGFYLLAVLVAGVLVFIPYAEWTVAHRLHIQLAFGCLVAAGVILWSLVPRPDRFEPPGPRLDPATQPALFALIREVAAATGQPLPAEVYLIPEVNAWVSSRGGFLGFGSRRVMGLGLSLLSIVTVSQLRAVLAHEFGHYYGGDIRVGPWIYKTRAAIGRTLVGLAGSVVQRPFWWYGRLFLRVTHAVSRRQEFVADELAARTVGAQPLIAGLRAIHGAAGAFAVYWDSEVVPVLKGGFRPPLAEGFAAFLAAPAVATAVQRHLEAALQAGQSDPYDTHPALAERIAAAQRLPPGRVPAEDPPALSLLAGAAACEHQMLRSLAGAAHARSLQPVAWAATGAQVFVPRWSAVAEQHRADLADMTLADLPQVAGRRAAFGRHVGHPEGRGFTEDEWAAWGGYVLGAALASTLAGAGWEVQALPGVPVECRRGETGIAPFSTLDHLTDGTLSAAAWQAQCAAAEIGALPLSGGPVTVRA
jgi:Zn-dependent protease with chaperone function